MTNKEKYKQAFSVLHSSDDLVLEVEKMMTIRKRTLIKAAAIFGSACILMAGGGGVAIEDDGTERPLTESELLAELNSPTVRYLEDGTAWIYYYDQAIEITDRFRDGVCYAKVSHGDETLYMTILYQDGWASSPHKYVSPEGLR